MVMMPEIARFVASLAVWQVHALDLFGFQEQVDRSVNRGNANGIPFFLRQLQDLLDGERAFGSGDDFQYHFTLPRLPLA